MKAALNPIIIRLGLVSFFTDVASEMLYPVTPLFLTSVLGASMFNLGLIEGFAEALSSFLKLTSGQWSDRIRRRKLFIVIGYALAAISKPVIGMAHTWIWVFSGRALDRTGKGLRTAPRDALLAESVHEKNRGQAFGWHRLMDTSGAVLGPLIAIWLLSYFNGELRTIYFIAFLPGVLSVLLTLTIREEYSVKPAPDKEEQTPKSVFTSHFKKYAMAWGLFSLGNSSDAFLLMRVKMTGVSTTSMILMYCWYNLVYATLSPSLGTLSDRIGRKKTLSMGLIIFCLVYSGFLFSESEWSFYLLFGLYGIFMAGTEGVSKAYALDLMGSKHKATAVGALGMVTGFAALGASVFAGFLWDEFSYKAPFIMAMVSSLLAVSLLQTIPSEEIS
jgi:MFS family permease